MAICTACKEQLPDDARFCGFCGFHIDPVRLLPPSEMVLRPDAALVDKPNLGLASTELAQKPEDPMLTAKTTVRRSRHQPEERIAERHPLRVTVDYSSSHNFFTGASENISRGGLFVATNTPAAVGQRLDISFTVPGLDVPCTAPGEVRWIRRGDQGPADEPGMGLRFLQLDARAEAAIDSFLSHREPILRDD